MTKKVLIVSGHPNLAQSTANQAIIRHLDTQSDKVEVRDLGTLYPDFQIDVGQEQQALLNADIIVWQFPFYWYSVPALMKRWIDEVFTHGFAYGSQGSLLKGKKLLISATLGGGEDGYQKGGYESFEIHAFFPQFEAFANLCGMQFLPPVYSYSMHYQQGADGEEKQREIYRNAIAHAERVKQQIAGE